MIFKQSVLFLLALTLLNFAIGAPVPGEEAPQPPKGGGKPNIIFMISDGMGLATAQATRVLKQVRDDLPGNTRLNIDPYLIGTHRTQSHNHLITDSAAGATAFSTGSKTNNGFVSVDSDKNEKATILEALKEQGYKTGLVTTSSVTDASPAAFGAHIYDRDLQGQIASQYLDGKLGRVVDFIAGGGKCAFMPSTAEDSCRVDERDLIAEAKNKGWGYTEKLDDLSGFENGASLPFLALFENESFDYELDREGKPVLPQMAKFALDSLDAATKDSEDGFFVMLEEEHTDSCGHANDLACQYKQALSYDETFKIAKEFADKSEKDTIIIATSDHETGGLGLGIHDTSDWHPEILLNATHTCEYLGGQLEDFFETNTQITAVRNFIKDFMSNDLKISDTTEEEIQHIYDTLIHGGELANAISAVTSLRAGIDWSTFGHSSVDVPIYAYTNSEELNDKLNRVQESKGLKGNHDNTEIGDFLELITNSDLEKLTEDLS